MARRKQKRIPIAPMIASLVVIAMIVGIVIFVQSKGNKEAADVTPGINYIKTLETRDMDEINQKFAVIREQKIKAQCAQKIEQLENGGISVWSQFNSYVIMGDSRAVGFWYYDFVPEENTLTEGGATIRKHLVENLPVLYAKNPKNIYLCYGLNDRSIGYWNTWEEWVTEYCSVIEQIHQNLPNAKIFISSTLPARDPAFERADSWRELPEWSAHLGEYCNNYDYVYYVDNTDICDANPQLWNADGIHVARAFYDLWAKNLIIATYRSEMEA